MTKAAFETEFGVVALTTRELSSLPESEREFLLAASLIVNDIRFYWSMMARSPLDALGDDLKSMQMVRQLWCLRKLASVIHEAIETLNGFCGDLKLVKDAVRSGRQIVGTVESRSKMRDVANAYRNLSAHHFSRNGLGFDLSSFDLSAEHRTFAHPQRGNSISELAEQIFTLPKLREIAPEATIEDMHQWCMACSGSIMSFCDTLTAQIITAAFPDQGYDIKSIDVESEAQPPDHRWPLFLVVDKPRKSRNGKD